MNWKRLLAYITGSVDQELLLRNEFLVPDNRILKNQLKGRVQLTDLERISLAEIGKRLGRRALEEVAQIVRPETILGWHRKLIARKFDGSKQRTPVGRPATGQTIEELVLQFAQENRSWGYRRIVGALSNLGYEISHHTVANVLKWHGLTPAPERGKKTPYCPKTRVLPWILENPAVSSTDLAPSRGRNPGQIAPKIRSSASEPSSVFPHLLSRLAQPQPAERHRISPGESSSPNGTTG